MKLDPKYPNKPSDPRFVDEVLTPVSREDLAFLLRSAWSRLFPNELPLSMTSLGILWAHVFLEVAGGKSIHNWNFGNIKKYGTKKFTSYQCSEILVDPVDGYKKEFKFYPYHPQTLFAAWDAGEDGCADYIKFLMKPQYSKAFSSLKEGNLINYVAGLKAGGYFTADLAAYTRAVNVWFLIFKQKQELYMTWTPPAPPPIVSEPVIVSPETGAGHVPVVPEADPTTSSTDSHQSETNSEEMKKEPSTGSPLPSGLPPVVESIGGSFSISWLAQLWFFILSLFSKKTNS